jgi:hypothetical protein
MDNNMTKIFYNIETNKGIVMDDNANINDWPGYQETAVPETEREVRAKRYGFLADTDWSALSDVVMTAEMLAYRQALRDIPQQAGFPATVVWPTKP